MKTCLLFSVFMLTVSIMMAQQTKDSVTVKRNVTVSKQLVTPNKNIDIVSPRTKQAEITMNQIELKLNELNTLVTQLEKQKDSLADLSQEDQLQLQKIMERRSKMESMLSNIMKKYHDTAMSIIQNMK